MRKIIVVLMMVMCMVLMAGCSKEVEDETITFTEGQPMTFTVADSDETTITYSDTKIESDSGYFSFANNNDYEVEIHLMNRGKANPGEDFVMTVGAHTKGGYASAEKKTHYEIGIRCDQKEGTDVELLVETEK